MKIYEDILSNMKQDSDGIYSSNFINKSQQNEILMRERVSSVNYDDYLTEIARRHSVPVMGYEVNLLLNSGPNNGLILDIGGYWGWHWRSLTVQRQDVLVIIIDFVKNNLLHA